MVERMQGAAYVKFLGRVLPLAQIKVDLLAAWKSYGSFDIVDMAKGYYFIQCEIVDMLSSIIFDGPLTFGGMVLQLSPLKPYFQPGFEKLSSAAVWLQLHHIPMELWHTDMLEDIASHIGRLLKIDDSTLNGSHAMFVGICLEIDLSLPLKQGFWVGPGSNESFITIQYECLPVFCFHCGRVGHGSAFCPSLPSSPVQSEAQHPSVPLDKDEAVHSMHLDEACLDPHAAPVISPPPVVFVPSKKPPDYFGSWMLVQRWRGRGASRASSFHPRSRPDKPHDDICPPDLSHARHVDPLFMLVATRGRGGRGDASRTFPRSGRGGRGHLSFSPPPFSGSDRFYLFDDLPNPHLKAPHTDISLESSKSLRDSRFSDQGESSKANDGLCDKLPSPHIPSSSHLAFSSLPLSPLPIPSQPPSPNSQNLSSSQRPPLSPLILLSSVPGPSQRPDGRPPQLPAKSISSGSEALLVLVTKVVNALCPSLGSPPSGDGDGASLMEEESHSESSEDWEEDMSLI